MKVTYAGVQLHAALEDLVFDARLRVVLKPLCNELPCFGGVGVSFLSPPKIDFNVKFLGGDFLSLPGLKKILDENS